MSVIDQVGSADAKQIDWTDYMGRIHLAGLKRFALKERPRKNAHLPCGGNHPTTGWLQPGTWTA